MRRRQRACIPRPRPLEELRSSTHSTAATGMQALRRVLAGVIILACLGHAAALYAGCSEQSLDEAMEKAKGAGGGVIEIDCGEQGGTIQITKTKHIDSAGTYTIAAKPGAGPVVLDAKGMVRACVCVCARAYTLCVCARTRPLCVCMGCLLHKDPQERAKTTTASCVCVCVRACTRACVSLGACMHYACMYACMYVCMHVGIMHACMHACIKYVRYPGSPLHARRHGTQQRAPCRWISAHVEEHGRAQRLRQR